MSMEFFDARAPRRARGKGRRAGRRIPAPEDARFLQDIIGAGCGMPPRPIKGERLNAPPAVSEAARQSELWLM